VVGAMNLKRMSAPYEQSIKFREIKGSADYVGVDYGGKTLTYVNKRRMEALMDAADALSGPNRG
jgi:hypothetical protein